MKRNIVIATVAAAALIAGGTATAVAIGGEDGSAQQSVRTGVAAYESAGQGTAVQDDDSGDDQGRDDDGKDDDQGRDGDDAREARAASVTAPEAAAAALKAVPGTVTEIDLDDDANGVSWEVSVLGKDDKWHDVTVGADRAKVLHQHVDQDDDGDQERQQVREALQNSSVDAAQAAEKAAKSGTVVSVDLDDVKGGKLVWETETVTEDGAEHHVNIDPKSGSATQAPSDDDGDDD